MFHEAITSGAKRVLKSLTLPPKFYLAGGTALALQLGHRVSEDLDFFNADPISPCLLSELESQFPRDVSAPAVSTRDQLTLFVHDTKVTFLSYPFPLLYPLARDDAGTPLACVKEIAAMKAYTIGRRGNFKDYVDLYFILKAGESLQMTAADAEKKYKDVFDTRLFLEQLVYFDDIPEERLVFLKEPVSRDTLKDFLKEAVRSFQV